ncbi:MAG: hypothetical protein HOV94_00585 [Saccharothrix sp.]|nr:hypothetical protein [Saccharothrix sp.]
MPLSSADLAALGEIPITIKSKAYSNVYLRLDGTGVTVFSGTGGGKVNGQFTAGATEKFRVRTQADGSYSFESVAFPNVYLRLDGYGVSLYEKNGSGTVNCQFGPPGPYEKFAARPQAGGGLAFESTAFPKVYLRLDGSGVTSSTGTGSGTANCQWGVGATEEFVLDMVDQNVAFAMQHQEQTLWCWDAATVSVAKFYDPASPWTQCTLANAELNRNDCCVPAGQVSPGNEGRWPDTALQRVGHFKERSNNALSSTQLGAELVKSAPVVVNIAWRDENGFIWGGHIVAVRGRSVRDGVEWVSVSDPWSGDTDITYDNFRNRYHDSGLWNVSYKTKPRG